MNTKRLFIILVLIATAHLLTAADSPPPPTIATSETQEELSAAFFHRLESDASAKLLTFDLFTPELDSAFTSPDGQSAVLWLALRDDSGRLLATEPGLALAQLTVDGWTVLLPGDPGWDEMLADLPQGMLPLELSPAPELAALDANALTGPLTGYYLPYAAGTARWLEGSISHFQSIPELGYPSCSQDYCRYAYDFTDSWHFPLLASRDGTVFASRDSCSDGNESCTNYIVVRDTNGQTYQIYLHLANGTIPDKLTPGTAVKRGQYLGDSDDTGYSTSQHVHFMVTNNIWLGGDGYYWGNSIDIRFADVPINNGIPRTCYEVTKFTIYDGATECLGNKADPRNPANDWFVSGNVGAYPPTGELTRPAAGTIVASGSNPLMDVTATAADDVRVTAVSLVAKINSQWVEIGPRVTQPAGPNLYDWDVDLCSVGPLNGPLEVALRVWDHEGNVSPALNPRTIQVDYACPPPASAMSPAETFDSTALRLNWDGSTSPRGFNIASFELQWRTEPGAWEAGNILAFPANVKSTWFAGEPGSTYGFRLRARDIYGQPEPWPAGDAAEISISLPNSCIADAYEPDDGVVQSNPVDLGEWTNHNLCGPGNPDWFQFNLVNEGAVFVNAASLNGGSAVRITVYAGDGATVLASGESAGLGQSAGVRLPSLTPGKYYVKVESFLANLSGTDAEYGFAVYDVEEIFLPLIAH